MLTKQEQKVVNLISVGYSDKEAADILCVSTRTVINHKQNVYQKLGINKTTELSAWYWCQKFNIEFDLKELKKQAITMFFILLIIPSTTDLEFQFRRNRNTRTTRSRSELVTPKLI